MHRRELPRPAPRPLVINVGVRSQRDDDQQDNERMQMTLKTWFFGVTTL
jgi:hypothetical protein